MSSPSSSLAVRLAPAAFVLLWSTGWIAPVYGIGHASAEIFLVARFSLALIAFVVLSLVVGARWPKSWRERGNAMVAGALLHGLYLGGVWWAIFNGVPAALSGLIAALQPLATAALAPFLVGERLNRLQKAGLFMGLGGMVVALSPELGRLEGGAVGASLVPLVINILAMSGQVFGALWQKRTHSDGDLRTAAVWQYVGALLVVVPLAMIVEPPVFDFSPVLIAVLLWSVFGLSMGGVGLYLWLIRRGQVSAAASLMYLTPPTVAIEAWLLFGDPLSPAMIAGTVLVVAGVWLANRK